MKKKIALLLAAIMTASMIPATAFAVTTNEISKQITGTADTPFTGEKAPVLTIKDKSLNETTDGDTMQIKLSLSNAEWNLKDTKGAVIGVGAEETTVGYRPSGEKYAPVAVELLTASTLIATVTSRSSNGVVGIAIPLEVKLVGEGAATVTVDGRSTVISNGTYQFGTVVSGATTTTIEKMTDIPETGGLIKPIVVTETAAGSMKNGKITLKLTNGFEFLDKSENGDGRFTASVYPSSQLVDNKSTITFKIDKDDPAVAVTEEEVKFVDGKSKEAIIFSINNVHVKWDDADVKAGDVCSLTISGAGITKTTLDVGTAREYSIKFTAENKTLPQFVSGRRDTDVATLKVTMAEIIANSWITSRKTTITFPEGVKILDIEKHDEKNFENGGIGKYTVEDNKLTLEGFKTVADAKAEIAFVFQLSIAPNFTGDIIATLGGAGVEGEIEAVIGKAIAPITVEADTNEVIIDYRKTAISDIIIKENFAGALEKGKTLTLAIDKLEFDGTPTLEVVEGDIKIEKVSTSGGQLKVEIKTATQKTPAVLKLTGVELYLDRTIPAGYYPLKLTANNPVELTAKELDDMGSENTDPSAKSTDAYFQNSVVDGKTYKKTTLFNTRSITLIDGFVEVVTAGRDQDDSTFTTTIVVTIGASTLTSGSQTINLDVPAYIANGYTMLPVRAVTEALSGSAIVRWDDATKTVTITFGSRIVNMVVGSKIMTMNGVDVAMSAACEITGERAFIPLRDLGYALGLNDSKIKWDDATKTATLN